MRVKRMDGRLTFAGHQAEAFLVGNEFSRLVHLTLDLTAAHRENANLGQEGFPGVVPRGEGRK